MKKHADQLLQEHETDQRLRALSVVRINPNSPHFFTDNGCGNFYFRVAMARADQNEHFHYVFCVNRFEATQFEFEPLPRDRELLPDKERSEIERIRVRRSYTEHISRRIAEALMAEFEKRDPKFGYSEEEWRFMHPTYDPRNPMDVNHPMARPRDPR